MSSLLRSSRHRGFALMECLFAILIFAVGILALVSLQATSVNESSTARYRTDASLLANQLIGQMWVANRTNAALTAAFASPGGTAFATWNTTVNNTLPGAATYPPTVVVDTIAGVNGSRVTITVRWKTPAEKPTDAAHQYTVITQIM
ncbi:prepilin-type N-terminal cleavage/methylation domain-containing protein [Solimonas sp. K1W22B-7]|uniref:type IV pilus modification PilV family protein n=1 Tax=Solimonas sp. K1W22B-7 TaxID=2303331 RepID=UPI000E33544E|nr:prepilin-type N-terminal cleavage/methylation domain-containing protein [Solimonas sp. K1W22B-7]AXQ28961.1 prepilin-type N-terminal cleavage/methylation domain-containing protein [Solimonas sp. K1W22B-7]